MSAHPWMPLYVADYLADTRRLSAAEHGAYLLLIMEYWQSGEPPPNDDDQLARITCMSPREWKKVRATVEPYFHDGWRHHRIDDELAKADVKHRRRSEAGAAGGKAAAKARQSSSIAGSDASTIAQASSSQSPSLPNGRGAHAPPDDQEKQLFDRGKAVLGKNAGGQIARLLKSKNGSIPLARAAIEQASTKQNPGEYIGAIIRGNQPSGEGEARLLVGL